MKRARSRTAIIFFGVTLALTGVAQPAGAAAGYRLKNVNSGKCALVQGGDDNAPAVQYQCLDFVDQKWNFVDKGSQQFQIRNENSGKCLLVRGNDNNSPAVQFTCLDFADQYWRAVSYPYHTSGLYLKNVNSGKCLLSRGDADGTQIVQFECGPYLDQAWTRPNF
ncbi:RICIN domain-containing protein [Lentzea albidocapillata]|uniref:RICIN domain-containing protein n=1 Tax=Lentzea albidocapillata TaxID=40571 RepID=UPI0015A4496B|nr:RICIN domain-containing protein [Lentzea albidocapillata]